MGLESFREDPPPDEQIGSFKVGEERDVPLEDIPSPELDVANNPEHKEEFDRRIREKSFLRDWCEEEGTFVPTPPLDPDEYPDEWPQGWYDVTDEVWMYDDLIKIFPCPECEGNGWWPQEARHTRCRDCKRVLIDRRAGKHLSFDDDSNTEDEQKEDSGLSKWT